MTDPGTSGASSRGPVLPPELLAGLRPHMVNLTQGRLSTSGAATTTPQDVDAIFGEHMPRFLAGRAGPTPLVFWAHGGLVDEASGVLVAHRQGRWWLDNQAYPIHFTWESGFRDALGQLFASWLGARGMFDEIRDRAAEAAARLFGGTKVWAAMKRSAELSSAPDGGARYVAQRLGEFCRAHPGAVELHAIGHSAGSIFHSHFVPTVLAEGATFRSLSLLAPAIRTDDFRRTLAPLLGTGIDELAMFTMRRDVERADTCSLGSFTFYHKSLLYLINAALEESAGAPILGLEESVQADPELWRLFGPGGPAQVAAIWSRTTGAALDRASTCTTHGGFDDDGPTMVSLAHRVTGRPVIVPFPQQPLPRRPDVVAGPSGPTVVGAVPGLGASAAPVPGPQDPPAGRRALCVGVDAYPAPATLSGCVNDARAWAQVLQARGFRTETLLDAQATRDDILAGLVSLVRTSRRGDVVVFQFSGHGTFVTDRDGDEDKDEALCPVDFRAGGLVVDDDLADVFATLPEGVNLTCFLDCCHSGTATRQVFVDLDASGVLGEAAAADRRPRFLAPSAELRSAHRSFRLRTGPPEHPRARSAGSMREVNFSACTPDELAWESGGQGDFTRVATTLLAGGVEGLDNQGFVDRVLAGFGPARRQNPELDAAPASRSRPFLQPLTPPADGPREASGHPVPAADLHTAAAALLRAAADLLSLTAPPRG